MSGKILVIDDDLMILGALERVLKYDGYEVVCARDGSSGLQAVREFGPDLVILDVTMPGLSGIDVCRRIRGRADGPSILMLSARDEVGDRVLGLDSGADDYLAKPFAFEELGARIKALLRRMADVPLPVLEFGDLHLEKGTMSVMRSGKKIVLSTTEFRLLEILLRHPNQVMSKEILMERVWGYGFYGNPNIVEVYIRYLRVKLELWGGSRLIQTIRGSGYVLRDEAADTGP